MVRAVVLLAGMLAWSAPIAFSAEWRTEVVDSGAPGKFSALKLDTDGNLHLVFVAEDGLRNPLKYGFWDRRVKRWFVMTVAEGASFCSLALDSKNRPHISYADHGGSSGAKLRYAKWDGRSWTKTAIPLNSDIVGYYTSIALDARDSPSISFYEYRGPKGTELAVRMRVVSWNGGYWNVETVDGQNQSGKFNALGIDAQGRKHLVYANVNAITTGMRYACWDGTSWKLEIFDGPELNDGGYVGYAANLVLDKAGNPHATYMNYSTPAALKYAVRKDGKWQSMTVERLGGVGYPDRNGIALSESGEPYISYYDAGRGVLRLARQKGNKWLVETVDGNAAGLNSAVQVSRDGVWIAYADEGAGGLKVAHRALDADETPSPSGTTAPVAERSDSATSKAKRE